MLNRPQASFCVTLRLVSLRESTGAAHLAVGCGTNPTRGTSGSRGCTAPPECGRIVSSQLIVTPSADAGTGSRCLRPLSTASEAYDHMYRRAQNPLSRAVSRAPLSRSRQSSITSSGVRSGREAVFGQGPAQASGMSTPVRLRPDRISGCDAAIATAAVLGHVPTKARGAIRPMTPRKNGSH